MAKKIKKILEGLSGYRKLSHGKGAFSLVKDSKLHKYSWLHADTHREYLLDRLGVDLVIDVGANKGQFASRLRSFYKGRILSFEPTSIAFNELDRIAKNDPAWDVYKFALAGTNSTMEINVSDRTAFSSFLETSENYKQHFGNDVIREKETVSVRRLDELLGEIIGDLAGKKIFLKMDTQGYDMEVFKGAGDVLGQVVMLQSEVSLIPIYEGMPHWTDSISAYEHAGFNISGLFPVSRDELRIIEYDCLMVKNTT